MESIYAPSGKIPFLLATDIDGTLIDDVYKRAVTLLEFRETYGDFIRLVYVTGRSFSAVMESVDSGNLPMPDYMLSHVGTVIHDFKCADNESSIVDKFYESVDDNEWNLDEIYRVGIGNGITKQKFRNGQPPYHAGFFWDGLSESLEELKRKILDRFDVTIIPSHGMYIDVIPHVLGKGNGVKLIASELGFALSRVVVAGDSGNDATLFGIGFSEIVPKNVRLELLDVVDRKNLYIAQSNLESGLFEGLVHYGFLKRLIPDANYHG